MRLLSGIKGIVSDLDGVIYRGDAPIESAVRAFSLWADQGLPYAFVTNNSTRTPEEFAEKLTAMGISTTPEQVFTTAVGAAAELARVLPAPAKVLVVGAEALCQAVTLQGFILAERDVAAVVAGLDRSFTYAKLRMAQSALLSGALFIGTNPDGMFPHEEGFDPGAGSILKAIETASGKTPHIIGKPKPTLLRLALAHLGTPAAQTLMIGDQISTDIEAGKAASMVTVLVRTGVPQKEDSSVIPDYVVDTLADLSLHPEFPATS